jgi:hypothetical protein
MHGCYKARNIFHSLRLVYRVTGYQRYRDDCSTDMRESIRSPAVWLQMERTLSLIYRLKTMSVEIHTL